MHDHKHAPTRDMDMTKHAPTSFMRMAHMHQPSYAWVKCALTLFMRMAKHAPTHSCMRQMWTDLMSLMQKYAQTLYQLCTDLICTLQDLHRPYSH